MAIDTAQNIVSNPYTSIFTDKRRNDIFSEGSDKRVRRMQALMAEAEFNSDLALLDYQNQYNSPTEKAARMRAAGLNPDLLGVDGVSDSSGLSGLAGSVDLAKDMNPIEKASAILENGQNILGQFMDIYSQVQNIRGKSLQNDMSEMALQNMAQGFASPMVFNGSSVVAYDPSEPNGQGISFPSMTYSNKNLSKRNLKRINSVLDNPMFNYSDLESRIYDKDTKVQTSRLANSSVRASYGFDEFDDKSMTNTLKAWNEYQHDIEKILGDSKSARGKFDTDYYNTMSGKAVAQGDISDLNFRKVQNDTQTRLSKAYNKFIRNIDVRDSLGGQILLMLLGNNPIANGVKSLGQFGLDMATRRFGSALGSYGSMIGAHQAQYDWYGY